MKAEELMIGDRVKLKDAQLGYIRFNGPTVKIESIVPPNVYVRNYKGLLEDVKDEYLLPIPLNPEILEKNGFEKVYDKYKLPNYRIKWNSYTDLYFTVFTGVDGYWNPIGLSVITGGLPVNVDYVHQLQHALRLCGIRKEIVL